MSLVLLLTTILPVLFKYYFRLKNRPGRLSFSYADLLAFLFSVDKSIGSGCFFPDLDPSVNLIGHAVAGLSKLNVVSVTNPPLAISLI
jgi:hypothetical protein